MFSIFARIPALGRGHALSSHTARASNPGHIVRHGRPHLVCRWRPDPTTRKPLCSWEIDGCEAASSSEPLSGTQTRDLPSWPSAKTRGFAMRAAELCYVRSLPGSRVRLRRPPQPPAIAAASTGTAPASVRSRSTTSSFAGRMGLRTWEIIDYHRSAIGGGRP